MRRRRQRRGLRRGRTRIFNREKKRQNSVDVIHAVLFYVEMETERPIAER